ncbi:MAG: hypothetical protein LBH90_08225 [Tannerella sp.]|nr:hypothetical protein [Tannerella sp.]
MKRIFGASLLSRIPSVWRTGLFCGVLHGGMEMTVCNGWTDVADAALKSNKNDCIEKNCN